MIFNRHIYYTLYKIAFIFISAQYLAHINFNFRFISMHISFGGDDDDGNNKYNIN